VRGRAVILPSWRQSIAALPHQVFAMPKLDRRSFLSRGGLAAAAPTLIGAAPATPVTLVLDGNDPIASARPVLRAVSAMQQALTAAGFKVQRAQSAAQASGEIILIAGATFPVAAGVLAAARVPQPAEPESFTLFETKLAGKPAVAAIGANMRGLIYAVGELADRARYGLPLKFAKPLTEAPANAVRSVMRQFTSETYDKPWFWDRAMWPAYFAMLTANRFNRVSLTLGLGYDMLKGVADPYLSFAYPFLLAVPGYDVRVTNLPDAERAKNLAALRYISDMAAGHGLEFQLGLWMHGYEWKDTPDAKYVVTGVTPENHAAYCRDALTALLKALPAVASVGLRIHGESGVAEGSYDFWNTVFTGVANSGRKIEIDLHAKGIDQRMIDNALATGLPVNVSPKFATEHFGLPYHPADIRPSEIPAAGLDGKGLMTISEGQRSFTRYGNADLLREDRKYSVRTRVFYGTQRILASGGAEMAAACSKAFSFCGMTGFDLMEPLTFRGRRGSAVPGTRRTGYLPALMEPGYDWQKYDYWYRSFGRMGFNPAADAETVKRPFAKDAKSRALEGALAAASRILPLVTHAHSESAACDLYWPEIYWNLPLMSEPGKFFWDTPSPRNFQNVTGLDPQLFSSAREFAHELLTERSGKFSPMDAGQWLTRCAKTAENLIGPLKTGGDIAGARLLVDIEMQIWLGRFFAEKLMTGVLYALHEETGDKGALASAVAHYDSARACWEQCINRAHGVYADDLSISDRFTERGQWASRIADIDTDIAAMKAKLAATPEISDPRVSEMLRSKQPWTARHDPLTVTHTAPPSFTRGQALALTAGARQDLSKAMLWYRHVNAAERWSAEAMTYADGAWHGAVPAAYTDSPYPLQYYFEFRDAPARAWLFPGFEDALLNQPYVVVRSV
jgi:hypothetical protein